MEEVYFERRKVSSFMFTGKIKCMVNLDVVFDKINIDECVLGMKYNGKYVGDIKQTSCFFNQISFNIFLPQFNKKINLKLFGTGSFQVSGACSEEQVKILINFILDKIKTLHGEQSVDVLVKAGFILNKKDALEYTNFKKERFKNIKLYNLNGDVIGYKNGNSIFFGTSEIVTDPDFKVLHDIVRNSFVKNVYTKTGSIIGTIRYELVANKNLKRIQINRKFKIEKISDTEIHYYKIFYKDKKAIPILYFKKILEITGSYSDNIDIKTISNKFSCLTDINAKVEIKLSNMNDIFYFYKQDDYYIDVEKFISLCEKRYKIDCYRNNTTIKFNVITMKIYTDKNLNLVDKNDYVYKFTIMYYILYNKIVISGLTKDKHVKQIEKMLLNILNDLRDDVFVKNKKFDENIRVDKISLKSLL